MAQLKDDCFAFGDTLIPYDEAMSDLAARLATVVDTETVPLPKAAGRVLAEDVVSDRNVPPHDNSAVDGYAVFFSDLASPGETRLPVTGRVAAGHPLGRGAKAGEAVQIFTGAPMPDGMDTVFMEEDCVRDGDAVILPEGLKQGSNRRFAGEDVKTGDVIVHAGTRLRPQDVGLAASVGRDTLKVFKPLRVAVFSTGDEVRDPSDDAPPGCIYDANRFAVMAMLERLGIEITDLGILPDDEAAIAAALDAAADGHHLLMTSGGVSAGEEDHVKAAVEKLGSIHFWRLAIKPGRPIALGQAGEAAFIGLPGNPVAAMVTFLMIAQPMLRQMAGETGYQAARLKVATDFPYKKKSGRREWVRVALGSDGNGTPVLSKHHSSGAGILTSMAAADGLAEIAEDVEKLEAGAMVTYIPFSGLLSG
ncbi:MAG: molybdopterin molybdotransferase MoeA [Rhodospirillales bacterium]|nr:molybdopterin molybdotransferase MoeA [Rhodospirillales bacterium]MBO6785587.1 molybdopterin molybdotransferase MoeA [Rhodospirillales bacterium]